QFFSGSGLAIYGGLIVAFIYIYWYVNKKGIKPIHVMDSVAPALIMGYAVGRIGCQLSGDGDWGIVNTLVQPGWWFLPDWMWAYDYPHNVLEKGQMIEGCSWNYCRRLIDPVFPTPFYETVLSLVIFAILWLLRKRIRIPGVLFFIYLIFNGLERFWIEKIRVNDKIPMFGMELTQAEIISFLLFFVGIAGCIILSVRHMKTAKAV
ncbi:MAG: prolipoprotein diacylglyceryl transferase, partial [Saprospiraceae bacterium]|nr:prolipoprotein diacylglyceryl transferase [Saprospiraceae bacterium]